MCIAVPFSRWLVLGLAGLLSLCTRVAAQPADPLTLQLFSSIDRTVVGVGQPFTLEVEVYVSPLVAAAGLEAALQRATFRSWPDALEQMREEFTQQPDSAADVFVLRRRIMMRALQAGILEIPSLELRLGAETYSTPAHRVTVYEVTPAFYNVASSILPVVAEGEWRDGERTRRLGTAFVIAPDAVVTSFHVILDARQVRIELPGGQSISTRKAWVLDPVRDVAILYVKPRELARAGLTPLHLAPMDEAIRPPWGSVRDEQVVFTQGWYGGIQHSTAGVRYRGLTLEPGETVLISSNAVRPGDSGGPLLDRYGRVLGVVAAGSIRQPGRHALREEICIALDVRPALLQKRLMRRPRSLKAWMRDPSLADQPYVQALRLSVLLMAGHRIPDLDAALRRLEQESAYSPERARLHFMRGVLFQILGIEGNAVRAYRNSLEISGDHFLAAYMLGLHFLRERRFVEAEQYFRRAREHTPYTHLASYGLARALMGRLRYEEATVYLQAVLSYDPEYAPAVYDLAVCALALGEDRQAYQLAAKLDRLSPRWAERLRRVLREPLLQPEVLHERPRATIPSFSPE